MKKSNNLMVTLLIFFWSFLVYGTERSFRVTLELPKYHELLGKGPTAIHLAHIGVGDPEFSLGLESSIRNGGLHITLAEGKLRGNLEDFAFSHVLMKNLREYLTSLVTLEFGEFQDDAIRSEVRIDKFGQWIVLEFIDEESTKFLAKVSDSVSTFLQQNHPNLVFDRRIFGNQIQGRNRFHVSLYKVKDGNLSEFHNFKQYKLPFSLEGMFIRVELTGFSGIELLQKMLPSPPDIVMDSSAVDHTEKGEWIGVPLNESKLREIDVLAEAGHTRYSSELVKSFYTEGLLSNWRRENGLHFWSELVSFRKKGMIDIVAAHQLSDGKRCPILVALVHKMIPVDPNLELTRAKSRKKGGVKVKAEGMVSPFSGLNENAKGRHLHDCGGARGSYYTLYPHFMQDPEQSLHRDITVALDWLLFKISECMALEAYEMVSFDGRDRGSFQVQIDVESPDPVVTHVSTQKGHPFGEPAPHTAFGQERALIVSGRFVVANDGQIQILTHYPSADPFVDSEGYLRTDIVRRPVALDTENPQPVALDIQCQFERIETFEAIGNDTVRVTVNPLAVTPSLDAGYASRILRVILPYRFLVGENLDYLPTHVSSKRLLERSFAAWEFSNRLRGEKFVLDVKCLDHAYKRLWHQLADLIEGTPQAKELSGRNLIVAPHQVHKKMMFGVYLTGFQPHPDQPLQHFELVGYFKSKRLPASDSQPGMRIQFKWQNTALNYWE